MPIVALVKFAMIAPINWFILIWVFGTQLCKIDSEGKARKVVGCSCVVVKVKISFRVLNFISFHFTDCLSKGFMLFFCWLHFRILGRTLKLLMSFNSMSRPTKSLLIRSFLDLPGAFEGILIVFCFFFIVVVETSVAIYQILWCFCPSQYFQSLLVMYEFY